MSDLQAKLYVGASCLWSLPSPYNARGASRRFFCFCPFAPLSGQWMKDISPPLLPSPPFCIPCLHTLLSQAHLFKNTTPIKVLMKDTDIMRTVYLNSKRLKISGNSIQGDRNLEDKMEMLLLLK